MKQEKDNKYLCPIGQSNPIENNSPQEISENLPTSRRLKSIKLQPEDTFNLSERIKECSECREYPQVTEHVKEFIKRLNKKSFLLSSIKSKRDFDDREMDYLLIKVNDLDKLAGDELNGKGGR